MFDNQSAETKRILQLVKRALGIDYAELGGVFGVDEPTIEGWMLGIVPSPEHLAAVVEAESLILRLERLFGASRVTGVVWRPAKLFGGERALEWILAGRLAEVVTRYEQSGLIPYRDIGR
jgi:hypothetical protein